jgi:hypothetical protein
MIYIGIDPGLKGGLAVYSPRLGAHSATMPVAGDELDGSAIAAMLRRWTLLDAADGVVVTIEKVGAMPKQGLSSTFKFGKGYGTVLGVCAALGLRVELVTPQKWKGEVLAGTTKDKDAAIAYCRRVFPMVELVQPRCRVPHDGIADALCLMEYGRRTYR